MDFQECLLLEKVIPKSLIGYLFYLCIIALLKSLYLCVSVACLSRNLRFFICAICVICGFKLFPCKSFAMGDASKVAFVQLQYDGGNWNPRPNAGKRLMWNLLNAPALRRVLRL